MLSSTPRLHFTPGKDPVSILQEVGWASGPVWTGGKSRPHLDSIPDLPACSQSLYRLSNPAHQNYILLHINASARSCTCCSYTGLFISPSGIYELDCATTKRDTAERNISIGRESLQFFFVLGALAYLKFPPLGGSRDKKWRS